MAERKPDDITAAAELLRKGGLVAFPTETVYGLGADAASSLAVQKIFAAKGRPGTNPLIVHVADESVARRYAAHWPDQARLLAEKFWPGPLTLVLPKTEKIVSEVTAGLETVGLRVPRHPLALRLLRDFDGPVAAPSANRSGRVSPTTAEHVRRELGERVDLILDGGPCQVGIESTVLDLSSDRPMILRPGQVRRIEIESLIGPVEIFSGGTAGDQASKSPGLQAIHYSPATPMFRFEADEIDQIAQWQNAHPEKKLIVLALPGLPPYSGGEIIHLPGEAREYAHRLYSALHRADAEKAGSIWVQMPPDEPQWAAVRDRLRRASNQP